MDNAFIMGCWFVLAAIIAVFVICALLDRRQFKKLGLPLAFPPIQTDKARIDHIRLDGWSGGMMELRYRVHNDSPEAIEIYPVSGFTLRICGATVPEGLPDLLQATLLPGHSITVTQRFSLYRYIYRVIWWDASPEHSIGAYAKMRTVSASSALCGEC